MAPSNTWTETDPTGSSLRSLGDDSIRQFKLDIRERLAAEHVSEDGSAIVAGTFTEARHKLSSIGLLGLLKGLRIEQRSYATSGNITVSGKLQIEINGDMCYLDSDTNLAFSGLSASTSYYIYAASPGHETELGAGNLSYSSTAPTYSTSKKGWYSGTSRAIGFFRAVGNLKMLPFIQENYKYYYTRAFSIASADSYWVLSAGTATSATEITSVSSYIPIFSGSVADFAYWLTNSTPTSSLQALFGPDTTSNAVQAQISIGSNNSLNLRGSILIGLSSDRTIYYYNSSSICQTYLVVLGFTLDGSL